MRARDNPFSTDRVLRLRYRPQGWTWPELLTRLSALRYRAAIVGPEGSGKTTLLEDLEPHLLAAGLHPLPLRLDRDRRRFTRAELRSLFVRCTAQTVVLLDGAEQLSQLDWWSFRRGCRSARGLIITTHRRGRLPTLVECRSSPELLDVIVGELLPARDIRLADLQYLYSRHHGNLREVLRELYDRWADETAATEASR